MILELLQCVFSESSHGIHRECVSWLEVVVYKPHHQCALSPDMGHNIVGIAWKSSAEQ
jgi:hypothetical protein